MWQQRTRGQSGDAVFGALLDSANGDVLVDRIPLAEAQIFGFAAVAVDDGFHVYVDRPGAPLIVHVGLSGERLGITPLASPGGSFESGVVSDGASTTLINTDFLQRTRGVLDDELILVDRGADSCNSAVLTSAGRYLAACFADSEPYLLDVGKDGADPRVLAVDLDFDVHVARLGDDVVVVDVDANHEVFARVLDASGAVVVPKTSLYQAPAGRQVLGANMCTSSCLGLVAHAVGDEVRVTIGEIGEYPAEPTVTVVGVTGRDDGLAVRVVEQLPKSFTASAASDGARHYVAALDSNAQWALWLFDSPPLNVVVRRSCPAGTG